MLSVPHSQQQAVGLAVKTDLNPEEIEELNAFAQASLSANSRRSYQADINAFAAFCKERFPHVPDVRKATTEHVCAFLNAEVKAGRCISTVQHRYACLRKHVLSHLTTEQWKPVATQMQGMRRTAAITGKGAATTGKEPLLLPDLQRVLDTDLCSAPAGAELTLTQLRDRALLLFMWFSACRRSEVASVRWADLQFKPAGVVITIRQSKTHQTGGDDPVAITVRDKLCAVSALLAWRDAVQERAAEQPVFCVVKKEQARLSDPMGVDRMYRLLKLACKLAGMDESRFGCHSTRSGFATQGSMVPGVSITAIQRQLRHKKADTTGRYIRATELLGESALTRKF